MPLITVLLTLLIDRLLWQADRYRQHRWFDTYAGRLLGRGGCPGWACHTLGAPLLLLPLLLLLLMAGNLFDSGLGRLAFGTLVLLFSLGPDDVGRQAARFLQARDQGNDAEACALADQLAGEAVPAEEPERSLAVAVNLPLTAMRRLFAPVCWFVLLGPLGAALYRLNELLLRHLGQREDTDGPLLQSSRRLQYLLDWLPARLIAVSLALAGNFDAIAQSWKHYREQEEPATDDNTGLLRALAQSALLSWPEGGELDSTETPPVVEDALALVWRSLVVWVLFVAAASLVLRLF